VLGLDTLEADRLERVRLGPLSLSGLYHVLREQLQLVVPRPTLQRIEQAAPTYDFLGFDRTTGEFLYTGHLIRGDLYAGQPCAPGSDPYVYRALIGHYECVHA
jgi:hypothetical protein